MNRGRKITGGKYKKQRKKKFYEPGRDARIVKLREIKKKKLKTHGGNEKTVLLSTNVANLTIENKTKKISNGICFIKRMFLS